MHRAYTERMNRLWANPKMRKRMLANLVKARAVLAERKLRPGNKSLDRIATK